MSNGTHNGHIVATPGTNGGRPRIDGTRIRVQDVAVWSEEGGKTPAQIVAAYPHLTLAQVHAALSYYYDHREQIRGAIDAVGPMMEALKRDHPDRVVDLRGEP